MQYYAGGSDTVTDTGLEIDVSVAAPGSIAYYILRWRVTDSGARVALIPPGSNLTDADDCAESASASGETATAGAYRVSGGNPSLVCASGETATVAWALYALTDEQP